MKSIAEHNHVYGYGAMPSYIEGTAARKMEYRPTVIKFDDPELVRKNALKCHDIRYLPDLRPKHQAKKQLTLGEYLVCLAKIVAFYIACTAFGIFVILI